MKNDIEIQPVDAQMAPWKIYGSLNKFASREHMLLSAALATYVESQTGITVDCIISAFSGRKPEFLELNDREEITALIDTMHQLFVTDQLQSYIRPFGGGRPKRMSPDEWEIDDPLPRFASSALDPQHQFDRNAIPTHWILVQRRQMEEFVERATAIRIAGRGGRAVSLPASAPISRPGPASSSVESTANIATSIAVGPVLSAVTNSVDRLLGREEVLQLTGFRKSTLYAKIASRTFPAQVSLSPRMSRWRESEVASWLRDPR